MSSPQTTPRVWSPEYLAADESPVDVAPRPILPGKSVRRLTMQEQRVLHDALSASVKILEGK
jgi:hypothetical protein